MVGGIVLVAARWVPGDANVDGASRRLCQWVQDFALQRARPLMQATPARTLRPGTNRASTLAMCDE